MMEIQATEVLLSAVYASRSGFQGVDEIFYPLPFPPACLQIFLFIVEIVLIQISLLFLSVCIAHVNPPVL